MGRINRYIWFLLMIVIGGGAGLYYAWYIKPADFVDAAMYNLRQDYKTDYVLMAAEIYDQDHDRYHAMLRLDQILDQNDTAEEAVENAIRTAEDFGYNPIDLEKMHRLYEVVTGQRSTPTPQYDPTMEYSMQQTSTAVAISLNPGKQPAASPTPAAENIPPSDNGSGSPQADLDPFGTGVQITTDPNAVPMLDLTPALWLTPDAGYVFPDDEEDDDDYGLSFGDEGGFHGISDDEFGGL